tara:strand:+ start:128 stop:463 length:336 start_codon:yes stop_codon:yes gene_type:complete
MKKIILYIFFILIFCDIAYATPIEALVQSIMMTIASVAGLIFVNGFFETNINPFIPFGIVYGIYILFIATAIIQYIKSSSKEKKQFDGFFDVIFFFVPPILVLVWLFTFDK